MIPKPHSCFSPTPCSLSQIGSGFIHAEGEGRLRVGLVGEAPGREEYLDGLPFRPKAQAGSKLEEAFRLLSGTSQKVTREDFRIGNIVWCQPPGNHLAGASYEESAIKHCKANLRRFVESVEPSREAGGNRVLVALGNIPLRELTGFSGEASKKESIKFLRGYVLKGEFGLVIPSYHPSFIKRGSPQLTPLLVEDIRKAIRVASGEWQGYLGGSSFKEPKYQVAPSLDEVKAFAYRVRDNPLLPLAVDIETPNLAIIDEDEREVLLEDIILIQFSLGKGEGIAFPFKEPYIKAAKFILKQSNLKLGFNWYNFDGKILKAAGFDVRGEVHDLMWMWEKWHPRMDRGLQSVASLMDFPFPWKHRSSGDLEWYGCADVDACHWIWQTLPGLMKARGCWDVYLDHIVRLNPILKRAEERGIPVSEERRIELAANIDEEAKALDAELQASYPEELKRVTPRVKQEDGSFRIGYLREPKEIKELREVYTRSKLSLERKGKQVISFASYAEKKLGLVLLDIQDGDEVQTRWARISDFKTSKDQLARYIKWKAQTLAKSDSREDRKLAKEYQVGLNPKTKKETTDKLELEDLYYKTGDDILKGTLDLRSLRKILTNDIKNWTPKADGRVHTTFHFGPPSGQLGSRNPNILNAGKRTETGQRFRRLIEAPKGYTFLEFDKKSFHVATMGFCANDPSYIRMSQIDPHSIFASFIMGEPIDLTLEEGEIRERIKWLKEKWKPSSDRIEVASFEDLRNRQAKHALLGNQLGLGPIKLQSKHRQDIPTIARARELQEMLAQAFPKVERFKDQIRRKAYLEGFLQNSFGRILYFFDVFSFRWNKYQGSWKQFPGGEFNESVAFLVQSNAFDMLFDEVLRLEDLGALDRFNFIDSIHDSLVFMPRIKDSDSCIEVVRREMEKPSLKLVNEATGPEGLRVKVDTSIGRNWAKWDLEKNPEGMREL